MPVELNGRITLQKMGRALSKLNSQSFMKKRGCFFILRAAEIDSMTDEMGNIIANKEGALAHGHAHVLMYQPCWFPPWEQTALIREITLY
ncbi:MAG: hypothetical protein LBI02_02125 [Opitutaceae bacterium]|jgi:hypothetical protein|nr:hypothetical protein [Opitutaceae bacterium]